MALVFIAIVVSGMVGFVLGALAVGESYKYHKDKGELKMADEFDIYVMKRKLDKAEKELEEAKVLLRIANETIYELLDCGAACSSRMCDAHCIYNAENCPINEMEGTTSCEGIRKWKYAAEVDKLLKQ